MRELKFRAWDGAKIRYDVTGFEHGNANEMSIIFLDGDPFAIDDTFVSAIGIREKAIVMQYTGLKDKNGKEIYEGDVLEDSEHFYSRVEWCQTHCMWYASDYGSLEEFTQDNVAVIGNIHENPELLSASQT